jgi:hypothetical protein
VRVKRFSREWRWSRFVCVLLAGGLGLAGQVSASAPTPDPMRFLVPPGAASETSITMTAAEASHPDEVEYYFEAVDGGNDSDWQSEPIYIDTMLAPDTVYGYRVRARATGSDDQVTGWSTVQYAITATELTYIGASNGQWSVVSNWNKSAIPSGAVGVVIPAGITVNANSTNIPPYSGGLYLGTNAILVINNLAGSENAIGTGTITFEEGSILRLSRSESITIPGDIVVNGEARISNFGNANDNRIRTIAGNLSGSGDLIYTMTRGNTLNLLGNNSSWTGHLTVTCTDLGNLSNLTRVRPQNYSIGPGGITVNNGVTLDIASGLGNVIYSTALLRLHGRGRHDSSKLWLGSNETVGQLWVDNTAGDGSESVRQPSGVYTATSSPSGPPVLDSLGNPLIGGSGRLTVLMGPGEDGMMLIADMHPLAGAEDAREDSGIRAVFSQRVVLGSGNITLRNLTDGTDVVIPVGDPRLVVDDFAVMINTGSPLLWNKTYAVRIDSTAIKSDTDVPFAGIGNDTDWRFSTLPDHPLMITLNELREHILGERILSAEEIAAHKQRIDAEKLRFGESARIIAAIRDLVQIYQNVHRLFIDCNGFNDRRTQVSDLRWTMYHVMQYALDYTYNAATIAEHEALLTGFMYESARRFPGWVAPPANPSESHSLLVSASFERTFGRSTQRWEDPARNPTGTYLAPGSFATVTVPEHLVGKGFLVRVGCHSWDLEPRRTMVRRMDRATIAYPIEQTSVRVGSPYGGGIYIEAPLGAEEGVVAVTITGAVRAPFFSAKSFHSTTLQEWLEVERHHPAPWADFQSDKFMMQVPRTWIYNHPDPVSLMVDWDKAMDAQNDLMGFPRIRGKETMYLQPDVIMRSSVHAPGYPAVNATVADPMSDTSEGYRSHYYVRGPNISATAVNIEIHEQGHAYFFPKFGGESESTVNLAHVAVMQRKFGRSWDESFRSSMGHTNVHRTLDSTAVAWMSVFNFSPRNKPMADGEKAYQLKGHAKFVELARLFGWDVLGGFWRSFMEDDAAGLSYATSNDALQVRLARHVGRDIRPLWHFWGVHPGNATWLENAMAAEGVPLSPEIYDLLVRYKSLVLPDNAAFQAFAMNYWGKKPSIGGAWEEREHARQWDQTALFSASDQQRADITINEEYIEACAEQIRARVQEIIDLYYPEGRPNGTLPSVTELQVVPVGTIVHGQAVTFTATVTAANGVPIGMVDFREGDTVLGSAILSGDTATFFTTQLLPYDYSVRAHYLGDSEFEGSVSAPVSFSVYDPHPPVPNPLTFALPPHEATPGSVTMTATTASDVSGVEYYFEAVSGGQSSGWQDSPTYTDTGLQAGVVCTYRVRARDKSPMQNITSWSAPASVTVGQPVWIYIGPDDTTTTDRWSVPGNWLQGLVPSGTAGVSIPNGKKVTANSTNTPSYSGGLHLGVDAELDVRNAVGAENAIGTGSVTFSEGSMLRLRRGVSLQVPGDIEINGAARIINDGTDTENKIRTLTGNISGSGSLVYSMRRGNVLELKGQNSAWMGTSHCQLH